VEDCHDSNLLEVDTPVSHDREAQIHNPYTWFRCAMKSRPNSDA
jgi:hypothetical protein